MNATADFSVQAWPASPLVNEPRQDAVFHADRIAFRWAIPKGVDYLHFQVARDPDFQLIAMQVKRLNPRSGGIRVVLEPGPYFWRIAAGNKGQGQGPFGLVQGFEVRQAGSAQGARLPDEVALAARTLRWKPATVGERYRVQIDRKVRSTGPLLEVNLNTAELVLPASSDPVFLRIQRLDSEGFPGEMETPQYFDLSGP